MKSFVKNLGYRIISGSSLPRALHKWIARNALTIIAYHAVIDTPLTVYDWCFLDKFSFREQIKYLKTHFNVVHLSEAIELIESGKIDRPTAVVTFDDGFQNNYDVAFPILSKAGIPATIFLSTNYIDSEDTIWFCRINRALGKTKKSSLDWNGEVFNIDSPRGKADASAQIQERLREMTYSLLLKETKKVILSLGDDPDYPIIVDSPYRMLRSDAIKKMAWSRLIEFGAHTHTHAIVANLSIEDKEKEIISSVREVEKLTTRPCQFFAYPNGRLEDYDNESIAILQSCGIRAALTMIPGPNNNNTPLMHLKRYGISENIDLAKFQAIVHHLTWKCKSVLNLGASVD